MKVSWYVDSTSLEVLRLVGGELAIRHSQRYATVYDTMRGFHILRIDWEWEEDTEIDAIMQTMLLAAEMRVADLKVTNG